MMIGRLLAIPAAILFLQACEIDDGGSCPPGETNTRAFELTCILYADLSVTPDVLAFGTVGVGESAEGVLELRNNGESRASPVMIFDPPQPSISTTAVATDIFPGAKFQIPILFRSETAGAKSTKLLISCDNCRDDLTVEISGEAR